MIIAVDITGVYNYYVAAIPYFDTTDKMLKIVNIDNLKDIKNSGKEEDIESTYSARDLKDEINEHLIL